MRKNACGGGGKEKVASEGSLLLPSPEQVVVEVQP